MENKVDIFFDFNFPIVTNIASTLIEIPTSTQEIEEASSVLVFPNPTRDVLQINSEYPIRSVSLFNVSGKESAKWTIQNQKSFTLEVNNLPSGIYMMEMETDNGTLAKKIVIE